jgi:trimeric autotransporter adhesin
MKHVKLSLACIIMLLSMQQTLFSQFVSGGSGTTVLQTPTDNVGIGVTPAWKLDLGGDFNISSGSVFRYNDTPFVVQTTNNLLVGLHAGQNITTGTRNSFFGIGAGTSNTTGEDNTFIGSYAGYYNTTSLGNTFLGAYAGYSNNTNTFSRNTFIGSYAGYSNTAGSHNMFIGNRTGYSVSTGRLNLYIGNFAGEKDSTAMRNIYIGLAAGQNCFGSNNVFLGYASATTYTGENNTIVGTSTAINSTGNKNIYFGYDAGSSSSNSDSNICIGTSTKPHNNSDNNILIGNNSSLPDNSVNRAVISHNGTVLCDSCMLLGDTTTNGTYHVGIGTNNPSHQLQLSTDDAAKPGTATWTVISDMRLKKNIKPYTDGLATLMNIQPVWFNYNGMAGTNDSKQFVGVLAQDMQKIAPYTVGKHTYISPDESKQEYLSFDANSLFYLSINAIKEQQAQIEEKDQRIKLLETELAKTNQRIDAILESMDKKETVVAPTSVNTTQMARLDQNIPNPFNSATTIKFFLPATTKTAVIEIYDVATNTLLNSYNVSEIRGEGKIEYTASGTVPNTLVYKLIINDVTIDQKKMLQQ